MEKLLGMVRRAGEPGLLLVESYLTQEGLAATPKADSESE